MLSGHIYFQYKKKICADTISLPGGNRDPTPSILQLQERTCVCNVRIVQVSAQLLPPLRP